MSLSVRSSALCSSLWLLNSGCLVLVSRIIVLLLLALTLLLCDCAVCLSFENCPGQAQLDGYTSAWSSWGRDSVPRLVSLRWGHQTHSQPWTNCLLHRPSGLTNPSVNKSHPALTGTANAKNILIGAALVEDHFSFRFRYLWRKDLDWFIHPCHPHLTL